MPRYMDRHNIPTATSEDLALAHEADLAVQDEYGTKFLTYWFDPADGTGICLVEAPNRDAITEVHRAAHGNVPTEIIEVDLETVRAFMGRVGDPEPATLPSGQTVSGAVDSPLRAIMFTDLQDSTSQLQHVGHLRAIEALEEHDRIVAAEVAANRGRVVKNTGDGFLVSFADAEDALRCAAALQRAFHSHNQSSPDVPLHIRIGLNAGLPIDRGGDLFGTAVQLAARLCAEALPDQILAAGVMRDLCSDGQLREGFRDAGRVTLKGFVSAVQVYAVGWQEAGSPGRTGRLAP